MTPMGVVDAYESDGAQALLDITLRNAAEEEEGDALSLDYAEAMRHLLESDAAQPDADHEPAPGEYDFPTEPADGADPDEGPYRS